jgi:D-alanyl-D-alanine carboxypeptidase
MKGVDGIKTGYTEAPGYNLVSSVRRDEKHIVAVVLGGTSNAARDARMRQLIEDHISQASTQRTVPIIVEANGQPSADRQWALYLAAQALRDRLAPRYGNLYWNKTKVNLVDNFSGVIAPN